jgi:hypothetical protein
MFPKQIVAPTLRKRQHKVAATDTDPSQPVELAVLSDKENVAHCWVIRGDRVITLPASRLWDVDSASPIISRPTKCPA